MYKHFVIYGLLCIIYINSGLKNNYGEFTLNVTSLTTCKGPKRKDCCIITAKMQSGVNLLYDIKIIENVIPNKGKIVVLANGRQLVRLQMKKPCEHLFMGPLFQSMLNVTHDCVFVKGHYKFNLDIEKVAQNYYGGMFLYGNLTFKSLFYNDECNFSCTVLTVNIIPKNNTVSTATN